MSGELVDRRLPQLFENPTASSDAVYNEASDHWSITLGDHGFLFFAMVRDPATVIVLRLVVGLGERQPLPARDPPYTSMCIVVHVARTNIDIDDEVLRRVQETYGLRTKREAVDFALRRLLVEPMSDADVLAMRGTGWAGDLEELRRAGAPRS